MACMCGDLYCGSCGPAQGNHKCSGCGVWSMDGPCADPAKCAAIVEAENKSYEEVYRQMEEDEKAAQEYWEMERATEVWYPCGCKASAGSPKYCPEHPTPPPEPREPEAREGVVAKTSGQLVTGILNEWIRCFISSPSAEQIRWAIDQTEAYSAELRAERDAAVRMMAEAQRRVACSFCGAVTEYDHTKENAMIDACLAHIDICEKSPVRQLMEVMKERDELLTADIQRAKDITRLTIERDAAKQDAESWNSHWKMYRDAWVRELGGWLVPKFHEIDSLVLTTRKRCVNPLLGNCGTPHWLGKPTKDKKALEQTTHPRETSCNNWTCDDSEPNLRAEASERSLLQARDTLKLAISQGCNCWNSGEDGHSRGCFIPKAEELIAALASTSAPESSL